LNLALLRFLTALIGLAFVVSLIGLVGSITWKADQ